MSKSTPRLGIAAIRQQAAHLASVLAGGISLDLAKSRPQLDAVKPAARRDVRRSRGRMKGCMSGDISFDVRF